MAGAKRGVGSGPGWVPRAAQGRWGHCPGFPWRRSCSADAPRALNFFASAAEQSAVMLMWAILKLGHWEGKCLLIIQTTWVSPVC